MFYKYFGRLHINTNEVSKMYSIFDVANWFLEKEEMTHKKVQKLCYYAQSWSYTLKDRPIADDNFESWVHGPVSPKLYEKYKNSGYKELSADNDFVCKFKLEDEELLESVWLTYGKCTANALEVLSHSEAPWRLARIGLQGDEKSSNVISPKHMKEYYLKVYEGDLKEGW